MVCIGFSLYISFVSLIGETNKFDGLRRFFFKFLNPQTLSFLVKIYQKEFSFAVIMVLGAI